MPELFIYPTPLDAQCNLGHDDGFNVDGKQDVDGNGRPGQSFNIPDGVPDRHGCTLRLTAPGYQELRIRGLLVVEEDACYVYADDFMLSEVQITPEPEPPDSGGGDEGQPQTPEEVINQVYGTGRYNLATHPGCGEFTEECCRQLHNLLSRGYGHIKKDPGQNQYNGHAVDAVMLLVNSPTAHAGIYDIIVDSVSPNAHPAFNYVEPPIPEKWYYDEAIGGVKVRTKVQRRK